MATWTFGHRISMETTPPKFSKSRPNQFPFLTHNDPISRSNTSPTPSKIVPRNSGMSVFTFYYQNVNRMSSKAAKFFNFVVKTNFDAYVICETSLNENILSSEFFPNNYIVHRCDRTICTSQKTSGGGVLIGVKSSIPNQIVSIDQSTIELVCVKLCLTKINIYIVTAYIPPHSTSESYINFCETMDELYKLSSPSDVFLIPGDFNLPNISWSIDPDLNCNIPFNVTSESETLFIDSILNLNLYQINNIPNVNNRYLDLILSNDPSIFDVSESMVPFVVNDDHHKAMEISLNISEIYPCTQLADMEARFNFKKANWSELRSSLNNIDWYKELSTSDLESNVEIFYNLIQRSFEENVPLSRLSTKIHPPWYDAALINLRNRKNKAYKRMKINDNADNRRSFQEINCMFTEYFELRYKNYITTLQDNIKSDPKFFWNFFNTKRETKGYPATMFYKNNQSTDIQCIVNMFAEFFQSVYQKSNSMPQSEIGIQSNLDIRLPHITQEDILEALISFRDGCGPDKIPSTVLKTYGSELVKPLCLLFNQSLQTGKFPTQWKITKITPIFKAGKRADISCYRGISSLSAIPKLFELVICNSFRMIIPRHISIYQHGFLPGRSTSTNLTEFTSKTLKAVENHMQVDTVYTDFSKAFDSVCHSKVTQSLSKFGFSNTFVKWIGSYLSDRQQYIELGGTKSKPITAFSGVPQGSHLGPWIFIIFINEITRVIQNSEVLIYADDLKIFKAIKNVDDAALLQDDLDRVCGWCELNRLRLNTNKCKIMSFHRLKNPIKFEYHINYTPLIRTNEIRDLGVTFVENVTFNKHIDIIIAKANSMLGFIKRWSHELTDIKCIFILYFAYVRSQLEFAVPVWSPHHLIHISRIESVQKKFMLYVARKDGWDYNNNLPFHENVQRLPPYVDRCRKYQIATLNNRRKQLGASLIGNVLLGHIDSTYILENISLHVPTRITRQSNLIQLDQHRTIYGDNEPINRMAQQLNEINQEFDFGLSKISLKKLLKQFYN